MSRQHSEVTELMFEPNTSGKKIGHIWFTPGISGFNAATLLYGSFSTLMALSFMNFVQPYLLTEVYQIPQEEQGSLTGRLQAFQEVIVILLMGFVGAYSDRVGRRILYSIGFAIVGVGYFVYPLASGVWQLYVLRGVFSVGAAMIPVMLSACIVDYIQEVSRGKWLGVSSLFNGLGVLTMSLVLSKTPEWYLSMGAGNVEAGRYAFWTTAGLCLISAFVLQLGLQPKPKSDNASSENERLLDQLRKGLAASKNPKLALAFGAAFIGRGDLVIVGTFFSLWVVQAGVDANIPTAEAQTRAGLMFAVVQGTAMSWALFMGFIADRLDRITALAIAMGLATLGYGVMALGPDPYGSTFIFYCMMLGIGEISVIITGGALLGQESARLENRGSVVGVFGLIGGIGILFAAATGGEIYSGISRTAPFAMMAIFNTLLMLIAIYIRMQDKAGRYPEFALPSATEPQKVP